MNLTRPGWVNKERRLCEIGHEASSPVRKKNKRERMKAIHWLLLMLVLNGCKERYEAPVHIPATGYLVIEGFINVGAGPTDIRLTRATGLDSPYVLTEHGAQVSVESENGNSYLLPESGDGHYIISQLPVDLSTQYRVRVKTADGKEYLSDLSVPKVTPPIDSVNWKPTDGGVWIYATTHDPQNNTLYYQWMYEETWEYESKYISGLEYQDYGKLIIRPDSDAFHICWISDLSTDIVIASSAKLNSDIIYEFPVALVSYGTDRLIRRYSILVKQYALTKEWYEWKQKIKKNTEQLGSIFDAQPSEIAGNIHCVTNPAEPVIGYVGCSSETEKRIFISRDQLPPVNIFDYYANCSQPDSIAPDPKIVHDYFASGFNIPLSAYYQLGFLAGYVSAGAGCVDCRIRGGDTKKPSFWP
jgi:hypothetical protein